MITERENKQWLDQGTDLTRILALSDGVFAIALTLLALDLILPELDPSAVSDALPRAILGLIPKIIVFALAFYFVVVKWMAHRRMFQHVLRYDSTLVWINNWFLLLIAFMPVPTAALGRYPLQPSALIFFSVTQILTTLAQAALWNYMTRKPGFADDTIDAEKINFFNVRYFLQLLAFVVLALVALLNVWLALGAFIVVNITFPLYVRLQIQRHDAALE